jgi:hypothetical protein
MSFLLSFIFILLQNRRAGGWSRFFPEGGGEGEGGANNIYTCM